MKIKLLLSLLSLFFVSNAFAYDVYIGICYSGYCYTQPSDYYHPSPHVYNPNAGLNGPTNNAWVNGYTPEVQAQIQKVFSDAASGTVSYKAENLNAFKTTVGPLLSSSTQPVPASFIPTPKPVSMDPGRLKELKSKFLDLKVDPKDPFKLKEKGKQLFEEAKVLRSVGVASLRDEADFIESELGRLYYDSQGVLKNLPQTEDFNSVLMSSRYSDEGLRIRDSINDTLTAEAIAKVRCDGSDGDLKAACNTYSEYLDDLRLGHVLADRLAARGEQTQFEELMGTIDTGVRFAKGFSKGLIDSADSFVEAMKALPGLISNYQEVAEGIYEAISNYETTWNKIKNVASDKLNVLLHGTAEERGAVVGALTFEVASTLVGAGAVAKVARTGGALAKATMLSATKAAVNSVAKTAVGLGKVTQAGAKGLKALAAKNPMMARPLAAFVDKSKTGVFAFNGDARKFVGEIKYSGTLKTNLSDAAGKIDKDMFGRSKVGAQHNHFLDVGGGVPRDQAPNFLGQTYWEVTPQAGETLYRVGGSKGSWWSRIEPKSQMQVMADHAVLPDWNDFSQVSKITIPNGGVGSMFEGLAGPQGQYFVGGKGQIYIPRNVLDSDIFKSKVTTGSFE